MTTSKRRNPMPPFNGLLFWIISRGSLHASFHTDRIMHTMDFVTLIVEHWLEQEIAQWVHYEGSIQMTHSTIFYMHHSTDRIITTMAFITPVVQQ